MKERIAICTCIIGVLVCTSLDCKCRQLKIVMYTHAGVLVCNLDPLLPLYFPCIFSRILGPKIREMMPGKHDGSNGPYFS